MPRVKVLILFHIPLLCEELCALLGAEPDFEISTPASLHDLLEDLAAEEPDVLLLDVEVLEREGWKLLTELHHTAPTLTILLLSDTEDDHRVARALAAGVQGYLRRDASAPELAAAIHAARQGITVLHPRAAQRLLKTWKGASREDPDDEEAVMRNQDLIEPLSPRELDVLRLMTRGMTNKQIAAELVITEHTVKFHIRTILGKLGAANRTEAVTLALQKGLVSL